jgi:hypothetical protein
MLAGAVLGLIPTVLSDSSRECIVFLAPCHEFKRAAAVFDGTVEASEAIRFDVVKHALVAPHESRGSRTHRARVRVNRAWKGVAASVTVDVFGYDDTLDEVVDLSVGRRYVFYARRDADGRLWAQGCGRTRPPAHAEEDIALFESVGGRSGGGAFGQVWLRAANDTQTLVNRAVVVLDGPGGVQRTLTDEHGAFAFNGLRLGTYSLTVEPSVPLVVRFPVTGHESFTIEDTRECHWASFILREPQ